MVMQIEDMIANLRKLADHLEELEVFRRRKQEACKHPKSLVDAVPSGHPLGRALRCSVCGKWL